MDPDQPDAWAPEWEGQRPPWQPGNEYRATQDNSLAVQHGAYSQKRVAPLASEILCTACNNPAWPGYLQDESYGPAVRAWAHSEAVCELLRRHLADQSLDDALVDRHEEESTERHSKGTSTRRTTGRRTRSALDLLSRWETTAAGHRQRLGLDPLSRARFGKDITSAQLDVVQLLTAQREAVEGGGTPRARQSRRVTR